MKSHVEELIEKWENKAELTRSLHEEVILNKCAEELRDALLLDEADKVVARKSMTVKEIVIKYLKANGFDGLFTDDCGCTWDDLMPCGSDPMDCEPGYKIPCPKECGNHEWHIRPKQ